MCPPPPATVIWQPSTFEPEIADVFRETLTACEVPLLKVGNLGFKYTIDAAVRWFPPATLHPFGTMEFILYGMKKGWAVNFSPDFNYSEVAKIGPEFLNADYRMELLGDVRIYRPTFIRQLDAFNRIVGHVFQHQGEWNDYVEHTLPQVRTYLPVNDDTICVLASPKAILEEYRVFVINQMPVSSSLYFRNGDFVPQNADNNLELRSFVETILMKWSPGPTFVLDVARTPTGWSVLEVNCVHCADFYGCNVTKIMRSYATSLAA